ncbi:hypothetical protein A3J41_02070 [candidate division TM6 bacterium RIFCSPHIGHO2_12_FULL_38_8]|nr:MAG: hypothetical protein A3J41_02070 [candidate division TM6 bacterium RIFCSPHIGHO2_12_FULL_38_8]
MNILDRNTLKNYFALLFFICSQNIQTFRYRPTNLVTTMWTSINRQALQNLSLKKLHDQHVLEQEKALFLAQGCNPATQPHMNQEHNTAFLTLQQRMQLPKIIPLFVAPELPKPNATHDTLAHYQPYFGCITLSKTEINKILPTQLLNVLLHELRHTQQHFAGINIESQNKILCKKIEQDAERFSTNALQCTACLLIAQLHAFNKKHKEGYFYQADFMPYIKRAITKSQFCKAHQRIPKAQLCDFDCNKDGDYGPLCDRIPDEIPELPFFKNPVK